MMKLTLLAMVMVLMSGAALADTCCYKDACVDSEGHLSLPTSWTSIDTAAFQGCVSLLSVDIPIGVTKINGYAFHSCTALTTLTFAGNSVTRIEGYVFQYCKSLKTVHLPSSLSFLGAAAFSHSGLESITFPESNSLESLPWSLFSNCESLRNITIPEGITTIIDRCFYESGIVEVYLPSSLKRLQSEAFAFCKSLVVAIFHKDAPLTLIPWGCFAQSTIQRVQLPDALTTIESSAFARTSLISIVLGDNVRLVGNDAFALCVNLKSAYLGNGTEIIGKSAFYSNYNLETVVFGKNVTSIGGNAFGSCRSIQAIRLPSTIMSIGDFAFQHNERLKMLEIPSNAPMSVIPMQFCHACFELESFNVPDQVTSLAFRAFYAAKGLTSFSFGRSKVTELGAWAFYDCDGLNSIELPPTLESIGASAFQSSNNLKSITIPASVSSIGTMAFSACTNVKSIIFQGTVVDISYKAFNFMRVVDVSLPENATSVSGGSLPFVACNGTYCGCSAGAGLANSGPTTASDTFTCSACGTGQYSAIEPRQKACLRCPEGTYGSYAGATSCSPCSAGRSAPEASNSNSDCAVCSIGRYSASAGSPCIACSTGYYNQRTAQTECTACVAGRYNPNQASSTSEDCAPCETGRYGASTGASSASDCLFCPAGKTPESLIAASECVDSPTSMPTGQPTRSPTSTPSSQPTSAPTIDDRTLQTWSHDTTLTVNSDGLHYSGQHVFTNLGWNYARYYLSLFVYDTGFGPVSKGEYLSFMVNGNPVRVMVRHGSGVNETETVEDLSCAPVSSINAGCLARFHPCHFNVDITDEILPQVGGSVEISAKSFGVLSSGCPHIDEVTNKKSIIFVRYTVSAVVQATPLPSSVPTSRPTVDDSALQVFTSNGLQLDINKLDAWQLVEISIGVGLVLGILGGALTNIRKKAEKTVYQHAVAYTIVKVTCLGMELTTMIFLIVKLANSQFTGAGVTLSVFRFLQSCCGGFVIACLFGPEELLEWSQLKQYMDLDHFTAEGRVYSVVSLLCVIDVSFVAFLPWSHSRFAMLSKGFPNLWLWRFSSSIIIGSAIISICCQIPFLAGRPFDAERDLIFLINLLLVCFKLVVLSFEYFHKENVLRSRRSTTSLDEVGVQMKESERNEEGEEGGGGELRDLEGASAGKKEDEHVKEGEQAVAAVVREIPESEMTINPLYRIEALANGKKNYRLSIDKQTLKRFSLTSIVGGGATRSGDGKSKIDEDTSQQGNTDEDNEIEEQVEQGSNDNNSERMTLLNDKVIKLEAQNSAMWEKINLLLGDRKSPPTAETGEEKNDKNGGSDKASRQVSTAESLMETGQQDHKQNEEKK